MCYQVIHPLNQLFKASDRRPDTQRGPQVVAPGFKEQLKKDMEMPQCVVTLGHGINDVVERYQLEFSKKNQGALISKANAVSCILGEYGKIKKWR